MKKPGLNLSVIAGFLTLNLVAYAKVTTLELPTEVRFVNLTAHPLEGNFTDKDGERYIYGEIYLRDSQGKITDLSQSLPPAKKEAEPAEKMEFILGSPAVVGKFKEVSIPPVLLESGAVEGTFLGERIIYVHEERISAEPGDVKTIFTVYSQKKEELFKLGRFGFHENYYNQYLTQVWPINERTVAIVTYASRHQYINTLFLYDIIKRQLVGLEEFSRYQYLPAIQSFWMIRSISNSVNMEEIFAQEKRAAAIYPVFINGEVAEPFRQLGSDMEQEILPAPEKVTK